MLQQFKYRQFIGKNLPIIFNSSLAINISAKTKGLTDLNASPLPSPSSQKISPAALDILSYDPKSPRTSKSLCKQITRERSTFSFFSQGFSGGFSSLVRKRARMMDEPRPVHVSLYRRDNGPPGPLSSYVITHKGDAHSSTVWKRKKKKKRKNGPPPYTLRSLCHY